MTGWLGQPLLDLATVDLDGPGPVRYLLHQTFRYEYDRPAHDLHQRLVAVPRERHGRFRRQAHLVSVSLPGARSTARPDRARRSASRWSSIVRCWARYRFAFMVVPSGL